MESEGSIARSSNKAEIVGRVWKSEEAMNGNDL